MHRYDPICFRSRRERRNTDPLYDSTVWKNRRINHTRRKNFTLFHFRFIHNKRKKKPEETTSNKKRL